MVKILTAIILGAITATAVIFLPENAFDWLVFIIIAVSLAEFCSLVFQDVAERNFTIVVGVMFAVCSVFLFPEDSLLSVLLVLGVFVLSVFFMWRTKELAGVMNRLGLSVFALVYLAMALSVWSWLRRLDFGNQWVLMILAAACFSDAFAYVVGKSIGKRKFAPLVSPNKTMEGFVAALFGSLAGTFIVYFIYFRSMNILHAVVIAFAIWIFAPFGDLIESLLKRSVGVKDSGNLIPGHGGVLDRIDALIFTGPVVYVYVRYILLN